MGLDQRSLYQGSFDICDVLLHVDSIGQDTAGRGGGSAAWDIRPGGCCAGFRTFRGEFDVQFFFCLKRHRPFDGIFQLTHIARPIVAAKRVERTSIYPQNALPCCRRIFLEEVIYEQRDILATFA